MLASRAATVFGPAAKQWASSGGLSGRWGLSIWSDGGSSLIPLSLGEGDQRGEPDTESPPVRRVLRKSLSAWLVCGSICWAKTLSLDYVRRHQRDKRWEHKRPADNVKQELHCVKTNSFLSLTHIWLLAWPGAMVSMVSCPLMAEIASVLIKQPFKLLSSVVLIKQPVEQLSVITSLNWNSMLDCLSFF